jgi:two-component system OmpR family response regulator
MKRVLVIDDDEEIRQLLAEYLERNGYAVITLADGRNVFKTLDTHAVDVIVLDIMMPGPDGLEVCRTLRSRSDIPVLMLSARGDPVDRVVGLEIGADDYLAKPFHPRELLARINVILKRAGRNGVGPVAAYRFDGHYLDLVRRTVRLPGGEPRSLTAAEFDLLEIFLSRPNRVLSRDLLVELTQGRDSPAYDRSIDVRVSRLRSILGEGQREAKLIRTVYGEGYMLAAGVETVPANGGAA